MDQYTAEQEQIARRRKVAEALLAQSMQPIGDTQMVGGVAVRRSPFEGFAKIAQAMSARSGLNAADADQTGLIERQKADLADAVAQYQRGTTARPGSSEQIVDEQANGGEGAPATISAPAYTPNAEDKRRELLNFAGRVMGPGEAGKLMIADAMRKGSVKTVDLGDAIGVMDEGGNIIQRLPKAATPDTRLKEAGSDRRHETPGGGAILGANVTMRGQDMTDSRTRDEGAANRGVTVRGQNMTDSRTRSEGSANRDVTMRGQDLTNDRAGQHFDSERGVIVDTRAGTTKPVVNESGSPIGPKTPESQKKELMAIGQQESTVQGALDAVKKTPSAFGFKRGAATLAGAAPESIAGRMDSTAEREARSYVFNVVSKVINERAGAAQSAQELARLRSFLPAELDSADQIESKLKGFQTYLGDMRRGTTSGASSAYAGPERRAPAVGTVIEGYKFKGGNPADQNNWELAK